VAQAAGALGEQRLLVFLALRTQAAAAAADHLYQGQHMAGAAQAVPVLSLSAM
jgi:hypothetical protein